MRQEIICGICLVGIAGGLGTACESEPVVYDIVDRQVGVREGRALDCDPVYESRCFYPWPSNAYARPDPESETGLRLQIDIERLNINDEATGLNVANGFSRVSPVLAAFEFGIDPATIEGAMQVFVAQRDSERYGEEIALRLEAVESTEGAGAIVGDPLETMPAATDHIAVVLNTVRTPSGTTPGAPRRTRVALGLEPPSSQREADLNGYYAPIRAFLEEQGIDLEDVLLAWEFTTRSTEDALIAIRTARTAALNAVAAGDVSVEIDSVEIPTDEESDIAMTVRGRLTGLPTFLTEEFLLELDEAGVPQPLGLAEAPFRVLVPRGEGDYQFLMYGHGTGGNEGDSAFDADIASLGLGKVNIRYYGWTDAGVILTFANLQRMAKGAFAASAYLVESLAHGAAVQAAMNSVIGDALAAPMIGDIENPAAGRRPLTENVIWVGGSLGGSTGLTYSILDHDIRYGVLNVPGAAWSHWVWHSWFYEAIHPTIARRYGDDDVNVILALSMGQTSLDMVDGAILVEELAENPTVFLVQESIGDPILPNQGTDTVSITVGASHVGGVIETVPGIEPASEAIEASALTQFRTSEISEYDVHGFANRDVEAGVAAREQIIRFLTTALEGESRIEPPPSCPTGCDFSQ